MLQIANKAHHHSNILCVVCTLSALTESYYTLLDIQPEIDMSRPSEQHLNYLDPETSVKILDSSCGTSMHYLLSRLQDSELSEFEAYLAVARNLIEKLSRLKDVTDDAEKRKEASKDFKSTFNDVCCIFEAEQARTTAKKIKNIKWLGRGTDRSNIKEERYDLLYAYLSRVLHVTNMDTLLSPREDRLLVKAYALILAAKLYHEVAANSSYVSEKGRMLHKKCLKKLDGEWFGKNLSPETLIYCTTYYDDTRSELERKALNSYNQRLEYVFTAYSEHRHNLLPKIQMKD